jgi:hypothetical protein
MPTSNQPRKPRVKQNYPESNGCSRLHCDNTLVRGGQMGHLISLRKCPLRKKAVNDSLGSAVRAAVELLEVFSGEFVIWVDPQRPLEMQPRFF